MNVRSLFARRWFVRIVKAWALVWLVVHMGLTVLFVMPMNPLTNELQPILDATIGTYFYQNWSLFAPNPVSDNHALLIRPLTGDEPEAVQAGGELADANWFNVSDPLWSRFQRNRLSAYDRLSRTQSSAVRNYLSGGIELVPLFEACRKGSSGACETYEEQLAETRSRAVEILTRVASAISRDICRPVQSCTHVALRVRRTTGVPWSQRFEGEPVVRDFEIGLFPIDHSVASMGVFTKPVAANKPF